MKRPDELPERSRQLLSLLLGRDDWVTAPRLVAMAQANDYPLATPRQIGEAAEESGGWVVGCGLGYKHARHCTDREIEDAAREVMRRGRQTFSRGVRMLRLYHAVISPERKRERQAVSDNGQMPLF
jgi:hypothetical protein